MAYLRGATLSGFVQDIGSVPSSLEPFASSYPVGSLEYNTARTDWMVRRKAEVAAFVLAYPQPPAPQLSDYVQIGEDRAVPAAYREALTDYYAWQAYRDAIWYTTGAGGLPAGTPQIDYSVANRYSAQVDQAVLQAAYTLYEAHKAAHPEVYPTTDDAEAAAAQEAAYQAGKQSELDAAQAAVDAANAEQAYQDQLAAERQAQVDAYNAQRAQEEADRAAAEEAAQAAQEQAEREGVIYTTTTDPAATMPDAGGEVSVGADLTSGGKLVLGGLALVALFALRDRQR